MLQIETGTDNQILRAVSKEIKDSDIKKHIKLSKDMLNYIKEPKNSGVGLAAPQVGYNIRLIVVGLPKDRNDENYKFLVMFNPNIVEFSEAKECDEEGCLSVPGKKGVVERYSNIKLVYQDTNGKINTLMLEGLSARIVQHEIDHLDGVLFTDKLTRKKLFI